jgi:hypothetical protein
MKLVGILEEYDHRTHCDSADLVSVQRFMNPYGTILHLMVSFSPWGERDYYIIPRDSVLQQISITSSDTWTSVMQKMNTVSNATWQSLAVVRPVPRVMRTLSSGATLPLDYITHASAVPRIISIEHRPQFRVQHGRLHHEVTIGGITQDTPLVTGDNLISGYTNDLVIDAVQDHPLDLTQSLILVNGMFMPTYHDGTKLWVLEGMSALSSASTQAKGIVAVDLSPLGTVTKYTKDQFNLTSSAGYIKLPDGVNLTTGYTILIFHGKLFLQHELKIVAQRYITLKQTTNVGFPICHAMQQLSSEGLRTPLWHGPIDSVESFKTYIRNTGVDAWFGENCVLHITDADIYVNIVDSLMTMNHDKVVFPRKSEGLLMGTLYRHIHDYTKHSLTSNMVATLAPQLALQAVRKGNTNYTKKATIARRVRATSYGDVTSEPETGYRLIDILSV